VVALVEEWEGSGDLGDLAVTSFSWELRNSLKTTNDGSMKMLK
jgi:hypothetical protein